MRLDSGHHNNGWVRDIKSSYRHELVAKLIEDRLTTPAKVGPYYWEGGKELPTDILVALADDSPELRSKICGAAEILLCDASIGLDTFPAPVLSQIFTLVKDCGFSGTCTDVVFDWLMTNNELTDTDSQPLRELYRSALLCMTRIQDSDSQPMTEFWMSFWRDTNEYWWSIAFLGLRMQNPSLACEELPVMLRRKLPHTGHVLAGMWVDLKCRFEFVDALRTGLQRTTGWAGLAVNDAYGVLIDTDRKMLLASISE